MRIFLRLAAVLIAVAVVLTVFQIAGFLFTGRFTLLAYSGLIGAITMAAWLVILVAGPYASVQLWRLRRIGLYLAALLSGVAFIYYLVGLMFLRAPGEPIKTIVAAIIANGVLLALLLSPTARRTCA